jgi:hypothetical protein
MKDYKTYVRFDVSTVVNIKTLVLWDVMLLKMEATGSSETLITMYNISWNYILEDCNLYEMSNLVF